MQTVLEQGSIDKPLTFDVGLIQLSFIPVCSLNTCNISVKLCRGFALQWVFFMNMNNNYFAVKNQDLGDRSGSGFIHRTHCTFEELAY